MAEVGAEAGRGAEEGLQRGQETELPDQELELSTGLREILQRPEKATTFHIESAYPTSVL